MASVARAKTSTTATRIGSCELVSIVRSIAPQLQLTPRTAATAATAAIATKATSSSASESGFPDEKNRVISRIGPNSPTAPAASR